MHFIDCFYVSVTDAAPNVPAPNRLRRVGGAELALPNRLRRLVHFETHTTAGSFDRAYVGGEKFRQLLDAVIDDGLSSGVQIVEQRNGHVQRTDSDRLHDRQHD